MVADGNGAPPFSGSFAQELQGGIDGCVARYREGGQGPLLAVHAQAQRYVHQFLFTVVGDAHVQHFALSRAAHRGGEPSAVQAQVVAPVHWERHDHRWYRSVVGPCFHVGDTALQIREQESSLGERIAAGQCSSLPCYDLGERTRVRGYIDLGCGLQGFIASGEQLLFAFETPGEQLEAIGGAIGHDGILRALARLVQQSAVGVLAVHAVAIVHEERYRPGTGLDGTSQTGDVRLREGEHERGDGEAASEEHQPMLHFLARPRLLGNFGQETNVREIDALEAAQLEKMDEHRNGQGRERPQEGRVQEGHRVRK